MSAIEDAIAELKILGGSRSTIEALEDLLAKLYSHEMELVDYNTRM